MSGKGTGTYIETYGSENTKLGILQVETGQNRGSGLM